MFSYMVRYTSATLLSVLLRRHWGILPVDSQENETCPIATVRQDFEYRKNNFCIKFISFFSLSLMLWKSRVRGIITYMWMDHWMLPLPPKNGTEKSPGTLLLLKSGGQLRKSCGPQGSDLHKPEAITVWSSWTVTSSPPFCCGDHLVQLLLVTTFQIHLLSYFPLNYIHSQPLSDSYF